ncbi:MAG: RDD family protein, partial [Planctomycetes bacterium]|nr:RDD family protein [Planctomycetota bacterium]
FQYWQRDAQGLWRAGGVGQGDAAAWAAWREQLLVFFSPSGRYGLFGPGRTDVQPSPVPAWAPVAACEDGLAADAFGWDAADELIHARLEDGAWTWRRVEGRPERGRVLDPCAVRFAGRLFFLWREEAPTLTESVPEHRLRFLYLDKGRWTGPIISRLAVASAPCVAADGGVLACLYVKPPAGEAPQQWGLATYAATDEDWHEVGEVDGLPPDVPAALGRQGDRFFVAALGADGPEVAPLEMPAGPRQAPRVGEFVPLTSGEGRSEGGGGAALAWLLGVVALGILAGALAARRRAQGAAAGRAPAGPAPLVPATVARRAVAVAVDYMLISLAMAPMMQAYWPDLGERILAADPDVWREVTIVHMLGTAAVIAYMAAAEGLLGRTVGKHLAGLEVRSTDGGPVAWRQAVVRNVFRVVDELPAAYLAGLVSILIGPRPQRIGDRVARTLVVMRSRGEAGAAA